MIPAAADRAQWSVMWKGKKGQLAEKKFGNDFQKALSTYTLLTNAGKKWVTLRCLNAGFAPPTHITDSPVATYRIVTRRGKRIRKRVGTTYVNLMEKYNAEGVWWCPYCIQLRRFQRDEDYVRRIVMECPVCGVTNTDFHVLRYNPQAKLLEMRTTRVRRKRTRRR